jgi:hypothetical protein
MTGDEDGCGRLAAAIFLSQGGPAFSAKTPTLSKIEGISNKISTYFHSK